MQVGRMRSDQEIRRLDIPRSKTMLMLALDASQHLFTDELDVFLIDAAMLLQV